MAESLDNIFSRAKKKTGTQLGDGSSVTPRVLKHIIDEGRFCEDELTAEYYGGILVSSRSNNKRDDRAVSMLAIVKDLSVYQLRFHYIFYSIINKKFQGHDLNLGLSNDCNITMKVFIPFEVFYAAMAFDETEDFHYIP